MLCPFSGMKGDREGTIRENGGSGKNLRATKSDVDGSSWFKNRSQVGGKRKVRREKAPSGASGGKDGANTFAAFNRKEAPE